MASMYEITLNRGTGKDWSRSGLAATESPALPAFAAIDLGTNSCRLLIARRAPEVSDGTFHVVDGFSRLVRLGAGIGQTRRLDSCAVERTLEALRICARKMERRGVIRSRAVATEACRRADNFPEFFGRVAEETGIRLEIISGIEEGQLALAGSAALLNREVPRALVFDIGGGSTEVVWIAMSEAGSPSVLDQVSIPHGVVGLSEQFGGTEVSLKAYDAMVDATLDSLIEFDRRSDVAGCIRTGQVQMLGTSGTVTTLAGVNMGLDRYSRSRVDGSFLSRYDAVRISRDLLRLSYHERLAHPCIGPDRADLVLAGCAILEAILALWPVDQLRIADRGLREGILLDLMADDVS